MSLWTSLEPSSATVEAGGSTRVRLRVRNTGDVVDEYRFEPVGNVAPWTTVEPQTLRLYPGTTGTVELTFAPPRTPDAAAGPNPYAVRIVPTEHPEAVTVPEGNLTIMPFTEVRAEIVPPTVKGRFRGRPRLAIDNLGNTLLTASVTGRDNGDQLSYDLQPSSVQIEPGRAAFIKGTLRPREIIWFGSKQSRPYTLAVQRSGAEPLPVEGTYVQRGFLPGWLATVLGITLALAVTFVMLWFLYAPDVRSLAREDSEETGAVLEPEPTQTPEQPPPPEPEDEEEEEEEEEEESGGDEAPPPPPEDPPVVPATTVMLRNDVTLRCADIPGYEEGQLNGPVQQSVCNQPDNQLWNLEVVDPGGGPGGEPLIQIVNAADGLCMDLPDFGANPPGTPVTEYRCDGTTEDNQLWWLDEQSPDVYWIRNFASNNACLQVEGYSPTDINIPLTIEECVNTDDHEWRIVEPVGSEDDENFETGGGMLE
ncbi:RICIN domain-containing protein [Streptomyces sp. 7-21]|uniref:RICIN domain-containing protein n=1 Tax=Streptomyces sp. 7-21 TaxID=2802283 RepID=UPI00191DA058|nr:RICIN domain-containing protein [Streptomyces sp. 7-21]MBL1068023.1 RICIN domain-containing protein [Streptomyces sp. 7-21]